MRPHRKSAPNLLIFKQFNLVDSTIDKNPLSEENYETHFMEYKRATRRDEQRLF